MKAFLFFLALTWLSAVHGYLDVPNLLSILPFQGGMGYVQRNNSIVMFGGGSASSAYLNTLYQLTLNTDQTYSWQALPQQNPPSGTTYGQLVLSNTGASMIQMGGLTAASANLTQSSNSSLPLQFNVYTFSTGNWTSFASPTTPPTRAHFSATMDPSNKIYIYGGQLLHGTITSELWSMDIAAGVYTQLPSTDVGRSGHTATLLSNGKLVILGGVMQGTINGQLASKLAPMDTAYIYDTKANTWTQQALNPATTSAGSRFPSTVSGHSATLTSDGKIMVFGGDNAGGIRTKQFLNTLVILDTNTWTWTIPLIDGIPPSRRSNGVAAILDGKHLTVAFGEALNTNYNDINVFDPTSVSWLQSYSAVNSSTGSVSTGVIAGVTVAGVVLLAILLFLLWRFQSYVRWLFRRIHSDIWKPRTGEPVWAETTRIVFQIAFLFLFTAFLVFVIKQTIDSPNITQRIEKPTAQVETPDVRFCFDGYPTYGPQDPRTPGVVCQTNSGYSCNRFITPLDMNVFQPTFSDNLGPVSCFLFRSDSTFKLTSTSGDNNGSTLAFTFLGDQSISYGRVHVSVFPKTMDPNVVVYGISDDVPVVIPSADVLNWMNAERNDIEATNVYTIEPFAYSTMNYDQISEYQLQPAGWNYVGFLSIYNSTDTLETTFRQEAVNPNYVASGHLDLGVFAVIPESWSVIIDREVKMYTLVNALGFVGGIFGILVGVQTWLFGFRPRSPWGVVHRWSVGDMRRSLLRGLQDKFKTTEAGIPLIHPVHRRFSVNEFHAAEAESEEQRIERVEERMQTLELLFKAYYVDDEVFRSLDNANKSGPDVATATTTGRAMFPNSEKVDDASYNKPGFSHMFNNRQSVVSLNSDSTSQRHLNGRENVLMNDM